jgi:hypothetical protein
VAPLIYKQFLSFDFRDQDPEMDIRNPKSAQLRWIRPKCASRETGNGNVSRHTQESESACHLPFSMPSYNPLTEWGEHYEKIFARDLWPKTSTFDVQELTGNIVSMSILSKFPMLQSQVHLAPKITRCSRHAKQMSYIRSPKADIKLTSRTTHFWIAAPGQFACCMFSIVL